MSAKSALTVPRKASGVDANKNIGVPAPKHVTSGAPPKGGMPSLGQWTGEYIHQLSACPGSAAGSHALAGGSQCSYCEVDAPTGAHHNMIHQRTQPPRWSLPIE